MTAFQETEFLRLAHSLILASVGVYPRECRHGLDRLQCAICMHPEQSWVSRRRPSSKVKRPADRKPDRHRMEQEPTEKSQPQTALKPAQPHELRFNRYLFGGRRVADKVHRDEMVEYRRFLRDAQSPSVLEVGPLAPNVVHPIKRETVELPPASTDEVSAWKAAINKRLLQRLMKDGETSKAASILAADLARGRGGVVLRGMPEPYSAVHHRVMGNDADGGLIVERICRVCQKWVGLDHDHGEVELSFIPMPAAPGDLVGSRIIQTKGRTRQLNLTAQEIHAGAHILNTSEKHVSRLLRFHVSRYTDGDISKKDGVVPRVVRKSLALGSAVARAATALPGYVRWLADTLKELRG